MNKHSLLTFSVLTAAFAFSSPLSAQKAGTGYTLTGKIINAVPGKLYLEEMSPKGYVKRDSVNIGPEGKFTFKGKVEEPTIYRLGTAPNAAFSLILENKAIEVEADAANFSKRATFKNSDESVLLHEMRALRAASQERQANLQKDEKYKDMQTNMETQKAFMQAYEGEQQRFMAEIRNLIRKHPTSPVSAYLTGNVLELESNLAFADSMTTVFNKNIPSSRYAKEVPAKVKQTRDTAVGSVAPDFTLATPDGKQLALSSLRGKYVLLDFWASWCGPCRRENPNVVKAYNAYKDKGFTILGVSLDDNKDKWQAAIEKDQLTWAHVSDLKGWGSAAGQLYRVNSIPASYLLDKQGRIVAKNLRGAELEAKLAELMPK
jgi:peroxiredoxin